MDTLKEIGRLLLYLVILVPIAVLWVFGLVVAGIAQGCENGIEWVRRNW